MKPYPANENLGLMLGMFVGDGALPAKHNGEGYRNYQVCFYNTHLSYVVLFRGLLWNITGFWLEIRGRERANRKILWQIEKYSKDLFNLFHCMWEIPDGQKAKNVFIPSIVRNSGRDVKIAFFEGLLLTDGCVRSKETIIFHCASRILIDQLANLMNDVWGVKPRLRSYRQGPYTSFQLNLNKGASVQVVDELPRWHNLVLR